MCNYSDGVLKKGIDEGIAKGIAKGKVEGKAEGRFEAAVKYMKKTGAALDETAEFFDYTDEEKADFIEYLSKSGVIEK